jgi:hypothetical protein
MTRHDSITVVENQGKGQVMQATLLLQKQIKNSCEIHSRRLEALFAGVQSLLKCSRLTVVNLGRGIENNVKVKHNINRMNRLVGSQKLHDNRIELYSYFAKRILGLKKQPVISIDWCAVTPGGNEQLIRATVAGKGRPFIIYESVYTNKTYNTPVAHEEFLEELKMVIPENCRPIIVTDAGFGGSWFRLVQKMGWNFLGRIRSKTLFRFSDESRYRLCLGLYRSATSRPACVGEVLFTRNELPCHFHLVKKGRIGRKAVNLWGRKSRRTNSIRCERKERDPWLLVTSLSEKECNAKKAVKIYETRMQIEESFRDLKNYRNGFALRASRSKCTRRFDILILISTIATYVLWLVGLASKRMNYHYELQTNSIKDEDVLSTLTIGKYSLSKFKFLKKQLLYSETQIREIIWDLGGIIL